MIILRIETTQGEGVYGIGYGYHATRAAILERDTGIVPEETWHPSPEFDPLLANFWIPRHWSTKRRIAWALKGCREWICAFESEQQMLDWFPPAGFQYMMESEAKHNKGVVVNQYSVHGRQVKKGKFQVLFRRKDATLIRTFSLEDFSK